MTVSPTAKLITHHWVGEKPGEHPVHKVALRDRVFADRAPPLCRAGQGAQLRRRRA